MNLLIVEDSEPVRQLIKNLLKDIAEFINECADGAEALAAYCLHRPDWVLMDIEMNGLDGISATKQIINAFPDAKIAIVTNYDDAEMREAAREAGACEYVVKENLIDVQDIFAEQ